MRQNGMGSCIFASRRLLRPDHTEGKGFTGLNASGRRVKAALRSSEMPSWLADRKAAMDKYMGGP
ncbi:hypothetical protein CVT25_014329 [Psilocybe cyanescens]|uniref:Uncharacterized protein n=1 Tax=Psilocybe cyanescens TaxID=93625 RepID=A0A409XL35_PSICY|nr:hypothetical protein CVT25_014329 [Psilocybe cyanescens]